MNLSDADIIKFQLLYRQHFGEEISKADANEKGLRLLRLLEIILRENAEREYISPITH